VLEPMKTCGNCWWWGSSGFSDCRTCLYVVPWWAEHERPIDIGHGISTPCPCWRERWVEER